MDTLTVLYMVNTILLIIHEIDSGYQEEWKLFRLPGGITVFLLLHVPMFAPILYGLIEVNNSTPLRTAFSLLLSVVGVGVFCIHTFFIRKGNPEFTSKTSKGLLIMMMITSLVQLYLTLID